MLFVKRKGSIRPPVILLVCAVSLVLLGLGIFWDEPIDYTTSDPGDYGNYRGVLEQYQAEYMGRFFPESLAPEFQDVQYHFSSRTVDTYGFEAYLEFTFSDADAMEAYLNRHTAGMTRGTFYFDEAFQEYVLTNADTGYQYDHITLNPTPHTDADGQTYYYINHADIAKILVNPQQMRVIYVVIAVFDGGGTDTSLLNTFFTRFRIDPMAYEQYTNQNTF